MIQGEFDDFPDARDGLTRKQRVILWCLRELQKEQGSRNVSTAQLYGRVVEHLDLTMQELVDVLSVWADNTGPR